MKDVSIPKTHRLTRLETRMLKAIQVLVRTLDLAIAMQDRKHKKKRPHYANSA